MCENGDCMDCQQAILLDSLAPDVCEEVFRVLQMPNATIEKHRFNRVDILQVCSFRAMLDGTDWLIISEALETFGLLFNEPDDDIEHKEHVRRLMWSSLLISQHTDLILG